MTTKETLGRRVLDLEQRRLRHRTVKDMSNDELVSIIMGYPCKAEDITGAEIDDSIRSGGPVTMMTDEELQDLINALKDL